MKLLGVTGTKLLDFENDDDTQDFIMINSKVFFIRTIEEYAAFSSALGQGNAAVVKYFFPSLAPSTWHAREFVLANSSFKQRPESLVTEQYYSLSAYKLGPREYVKYSVRPCPENQPLRPPYASAPNFFSRVWKKLLWPYASLSATSMDPDTYYDYLRQELSNQSNRGGACFDFLVQPQVADKNMPIEDTTVEWNEKVSPFVRVARITINAGADNTADANRTCEALSFNPWHALPEHQPVGCDEPRPQGAVPKHGPLSPNEELPAVLSIRMRRGRRRAVLQIRMLRLLHGQVSAAERTRNGGASIPRECLPVCGENSDHRCTPAFDDERGH